MTLTKTMFLFGALSVALILPFSLIEMEETPRISIPFAEATPNQNANEMSIQNTPNEIARNMEEPPAWDLATEALDFDFELDLPSQVNVNALNDLKIEVAKNPQVKELLGDDFEYTNYHQYGTDYGWQPVLHYLTDNGEYTVTVTMDKGKVVDVIKYETVIWGGPYQTNTDSSYTITDDSKEPNTSMHSGSRGFAMNEYDDDRYQARGVAMYVHVPDYTYNAGTFTVLLLNAQKVGSNNYDVCDPTKIPASYRGQIGISFDPLGTHMVYSDTTLECNGRIFPNLQYKTGDRMLFAIHIINGIDKWVMYADNLDDPNHAVAWITDVPGSTFIDTDSRNTSIFFENANHYSNTNWASGFASDPVVEKAIWQYTNNYWYRWLNENQMAVYCEGISGDELMDGTFVEYPYDVTFDVSEIQEKCTAP